MRPEIVAQQLEVENREPLLAEIEAFITAVQEKSAPVVSGADGRRALALAHQVLEKIRIHSTHAGIKLIVDN